MLRCCIVLIFNKMYFLTILNFFIFYVGIVEAVKIEEFCSADFKIDCKAHDEAIMIVNATLGINNESKCFKLSQPVECFDDHTISISKSCFGKRSCSIKSYKEKLSGKCLVYNVHLKVSYVCQKVVRAPCALCSELGKAQVSHSSGYLANFVSAESTCGQKKCPWLIKGQSGQKINLTLYDYSTYSDHHEPHHVPSKDKLFAISGHIQRKDMSVYREPGQPYVRHVHTSLESKIELTIHNKSLPFLIYFEVWGCSDLPLSEGTWMKRIGNTMKVGCSESDLAWELVCLGNEWKGDRGECQGLQGAGVFKGLAESFSGFFSALPFSILIAIVVSIAIILSVCILTIGFVCYRKSNQAFGYKASRQGSSMGDQYVDINDPNSSLVQKIMATQKKKYAMAQRENKYAMNNCVPAGTRPLPSIPNMRSNDASVNSAMPPRMMIRSYGEGTKRQSGGNKYYCIENSLGPSEMVCADFDMFPPPPELLQAPESSQGSAGKNHSDKMFAKNNTYENQQAILGTMATAGITAAAAASSEMLNKSMNGKEKGACISAPLNI